MKIVVLYGEDEVKSRNRYFQIIDTLRKRGWEQVSLNPSKKISEQLSGSSLFETDRIYTCDKASKITSAEYIWIQKHLDEYDGSLLLYFDKNVPAAIKKLLPKSTKFEEFKLQKKLFLFLETVYPGNGKNSLKLLHDVIETDAVELVVAMLARHLRDLYTLKVSDGQSNLPDWRRRKLESQLSKFKEKTLENFIEELSDADVKSKSGQGELVILLDLAIMKL